VYVVAAIGSVDRLDPLGALRREILLLMQAAELLEAAEDVLHDRPGVKGFAPLAADLAQRRGEGRVAHPVADLGRLPARQHDFGGRRILQFPLVAVPIPGDARRYAV